MAAAASGLGLEITALRLGLPGGGGGGAEEMIRNEKKKRVFSQIEEDGTGKQKSRDHQVVVGWPPVCSYRRKNRVNNNDADDDRDGGGESSAKILYVKVSMDGAPFLRKINLTAQKDYSDLEINLHKLFRSCFGSAVELYISEYVPIYEDKDGDWMLVGDVPWMMFMESCKKLRIMKRTEAIGIGLRVNTKSA